LGIITRRAGGAPQTRVLQLPKPHVRSLSQRHLAARAG